MRTVLIIGALVVGLLALLAVEIFVMPLFREMPTLEAELEIPANATVGESVRMVLSLSNPHSGEVTLDSIDIDDAFLEGFRVEMVEPEPVDTDHIPIISQRSWQFDRPLAPGGTLTVTYHMVAVQSGHYSGDVDVCNPNQDWTTVVPDVFVGPAE